MESGKLTWKNRDDLIHKLSLIRERKQSIWFQDITCIKWSQQKNKWEDIDFKYFELCDGMTQINDEYETDEALADRLIDCTGEFESEYEILKD